MRILYGEITLGWYRATRGALLWALGIVAVLCLLVLPGRNDPDLITTGYGLALYWGILLIASLWCGGTTYALDRERHRLALVFSKPIHRFKHWWGRWLAVWLPFCCAALFGTIFLVFRPLPEGRFVLKPQLPDTHAAAIEELARLRTLGRVPEGISEARLRRAVQEDLETRYTELQPHKPMNYTFQLPDALPQKAHATFRLSGAPILGAKDALRLTLEVVCANNVLHFSPTQLNDMGFSLTLPNHVLVPGEPLTLKLLRLDRNKAVSVIFQEYQDIHLLLPGISPWNNLFRFTLVMILTLALTTALGVTLGSTFSLPVTLFTGSLALLAYSVSIFSPTLSAIDASANLWAKIGTFISETLAHPFSDLTQLDPLNALLKGETLRFELIFAFCAKVILPALLLCATCSCVSSVKDEDA